MKDTRFLKLSENWALATDGLQWIIQRYRHPRWHSLSFIAQSKAVLERDLRRHRAEVDFAARRALDHLPAAFKDWRNPLRDQNKDWVSVLGTRFDETLPPDDKARNGARVREEVQ